MLDPCFTINIKLNLLYKLKAQNKNQTKLYKNLGKTKLNGFQASKTEIASQFYRK